MAKKSEPKVAKVTPIRGRNKYRTVMRAHAQEKPYEKSSFSYSRLEQLDGTHPWKDDMPNGYISYPVRILKQGQVGYFNFRLAKEMGLIAPSHPEKYNEELNKKLIETFSLQIINEYDQVNRRRYSKNNMKKNEYMATRYLQLQHVDKTGKTSGDGRSIWNGTVEHEGVTWDVSSRGTGVTALAPGAVEAGKPLKTGSETYGYGCGLAEIDELYGTAIMSEIFHQQGIHTERTLAIIDLGKGVGIGVRAGQNLLRPAHLFSYLKQGDHDSLVKAMDYLIQRQYQNGVWKFSSRHAKKYNKIQEEFCNSYARFAAILDVDYIFAWLDWDGDNALADAGIIDYGSIRQFGLRFDQYRYDDVERFSTNLNEQKGKAHLMVQVFVQAVDFARTGVKKPLENFKDHHIVQMFEKSFNEARLDRILYRVGFDGNNRKYLLSDHRAAVEKFVEEYSFLERKKTSAPATKVSDGVNRAALFNIRNILRELPHHLATAPQFETARLERDEFFDILFAHSCTTNDRELASSTKQYCESFQEAYKDLIRRAKRKRSIQRMLTDLSVRSDRINTSCRITGNGIINVVDAVLNAKNKGLAAQDLYNVLTKFIASQSLDPDREYRRTKISVAPNSHAKKLFNEFLEIVERCSEDI